MDSNAVRIYRALHERIVTGGVGRGERLRQEALAAEFDVSRTPLREALRWLAAEGLVELEPRRGARVADVRPEDMEQAYDARFALEPGAARLAAAVRRPDALEAMAVAVNRHRHVRAGDVPASFAANRDFHLALVAAGDNDHLTRLAELLWVPRIGGAIHERRRETQADVRADVLDHEAIADAVARGEEDEAERLTTEHLERAVASFRRAG